MQFFTHRDTDQPHFLDSESIQFDDQEIAPGVQLERRWVFKGAVGLLLSGLLHRSADAFVGAEKELSEVATQEGGNQLALEDLIKQVLPLAKDLIKSSQANEEAYVEKVQKFLSQAADLEVNRAFPGGKGWELDASAFVPPILLYQIRMQPRAIIELHDHRFHNGVISVREGKVRSRNFDIVVPPGREDWNVAEGKVAAIGEEFQIQEKSDSICVAGQATALTRTRHNIHQIEAGEDGCLLYDLFTNFRPNAQSFRIAWDGKYSDQAKKICTVQWIAPDHEH